MENQEKLMQFVTWLGENVPELKGKAPEQIVETVNKLSASEQGQQMLQGLIKEFESSMTGMFKKGGKLGYLLCLKSGGSIQDCGCGKKIRKGQDGIDSMEELPSSSSPKYSRRDAVKAAMSMGMNRSQLDSPTLGLHTGGIVIPEKEFLPVNPEQYPHASRKDAIDAARQLGFEGSDARRAYGDSKKIARQLGFRGNNLRQVARYNLIDMAYPRAGMTEEESMNNLLNNFTTKISYN